MYLHANAKLGLAGRLALVRAIEDGLSFRAAAAAFSISPATAHRWWRRWTPVRVRRPGEACPVCLIARAVRVAHRGNWRPSSPSGSVPAAARPVGVRAWSLVRPASPTRPSGRCSSVPGSRGQRRRSRSRPTGTSGRAPATCCIWMSAAMHGSCGLATRSPATAHSAHATGCVPRPGSAATTRTRSSTITRGSPMSRSTTTQKAATVSLHGTSARLLRRARDHCKAADDRQRLHLCQEPLAPQYNNT